MILSDRRSDLSRNCQRSFSCSCSRGDFDTLNLAPADPCQLAWQVNQTGRLGRYTPKPTAEQSAFHWCGGSTRPNRAAPSASSGQAACGLGELRLSGTSRARPGTLRVLSQLACQSPSPASKLVGVAGPPIEHCPAESVKVSKAGRGLRGSRCDAC